MLNERRLRKWRKEALIFNLDLELDEIYTSKLIYAEKLKEANTRIIKMTQELLDQHLLNK